MPGVVHIPQNQLKGLISYFWYCNEENVDNHCISLPIPGIEIVLNYSDSYLISSAAGQPSLNDQRFWVSGLQSKQFKASITGHNKNVGILFSPAGLSAFMPIPLSHLAGDHIDLQELWREDIRLLWQQVGEAITVNEKFRLLESFFIRRLRAGRNPDLRLQMILQKLHHHPQDIRIKDLCSQYRISGKSLHLMFKQKVGTSPGAYRRLLLFNKALQSLSTKHRGRLSDVAYHCGYFDQAHFIRDFRSYSGLTPGEYLKGCETNRTSTDNPNYIAVHTG
jgi:AraC-like DNA-binding protein